MRMRVLPMQLKMLYPLAATLQGMLYLRAKNVDCGYGGTAEHLTVSPGNVVAGVKVAVRDGVVLSGLDKSTYRSRNMIGVLADGRIIVVQSSDGCTEEQVARYAAGRYTIKLLLVQDAGGSTGMYRVSDGYLFAPEKEDMDGRPVCSVVCMRKKNRRRNLWARKRYLSAWATAAATPARLVIWWRRT